MIAEPVARSDFWRRTASSFARDTGHAFLVPFLPDTALQVTFLADFERLGMLIRVDEATWIEAGIEITDGGPRVAMVAANGLSDWSLRWFPHGKDKP